MKYPNRYIHIGLPKTGTSAIQHFLMLNRKELINQGILYPAENIINNAHYPLAWVLTPNHPSFKRLKKKTANDVWLKLNKEVLQHQPLKVVVSSEDFIHAENLNLLKKNVSGYNVKVIIYLRRQDELIQSLYIQLVKQNIKRLNQDINHYISNPYLPLCNFEKYLERWEYAFGKENLLIRMYEKSQLPNGIYIDFLETIGVHNYNHFKKPDDINISLERDTLEYLKISNNVSMADNIHNRLVKELEKISGEICKKSQFINHSLFSPKERLRIIKEYDELNKRVAEKYLKKKNLFLQPWISSDESWKPYDGLSLEKAIQIHTSLWAEQQKQIIHLNKTIQKLNIDKNNQNINDLDLARNFSFLSLVKAIGKKIQAKFLYH